MIRVQVCNKCGLSMVHQSPLVCRCGQPMVTLSPRTSGLDALSHVPVYTVRNGIVNVRVGKVRHPMSKDHYIEWICVETDSDDRVYKNFEPGAQSKAEATFTLKSGERVAAVYAYCNKHRLWMAYILSDL